MKSSTVMLFIPFVGNKKIMMNYSFKTVLIIGFSVACLLATAQEKNIILGVKGGVCFYRRVKILR
jgi:hypothetical protein